MVKYLCAVHCSNLAMSLKTQLSNVKINTCVMHLPSKCPGAEGSIPTDRERHVHSYCTLFVYQAAKAQSAVQHCHCSIQITQLYRSPVFAVAVCQNTVFYQQKPMLVPGFISIYEHVKLWQSWNRGCQDLDHQETD